MAKMKYTVGLYAEAPVEPEIAREYTSLLAARKAVRAHFGGRLPNRDTSLAGETYEDGSCHVEAYYFDEHKSSGYWICRM
jgi:hypothetical protein